MYVSCRRWPHSVDGVSSMRSSNGRIASFVGLHVGREGISDKRRGKQRAFTLYLVSVWASVEASVELHGNPYGNHGPRRKFDKIQWICRWRLSDQAGASRNAAGLQASAKRSKRATSGTTWRSRRVSCVAFSVSACCTAGIGKLSSVFASVTHAPDGALGYFNLANCRRSRNTKQRASCRPSIKGRTCSLRSLTGGRWDKISGRHFCS